MSSNFNLQNVPSVFTTAPSPKMTNKYTFVPTVEILEKFDKEGWKVASAKQMGRSVYSSHQVKLRNGDLPQVGDSIVEALINNSHNGSTTFSLSAGLFRLVCSNGLTVPSSVFNTMTFKHMKIDLDMVKRITEDFANNLPIIGQSVKKMENTTLSENMAMDMVNKASMIRWEKGSVPSSIILQDLIKPIREADQGMTVWKTFNVIQEKFIKGGVKYNSQKGRTVSTKELENFHRINKINTSLWELAESYC